MVSQTLAHYKILEKIGSGGMGEVYLAEDTKLDRKVALKVLPPELAESEERRARFQREAKAIAALNHPNIVHVYSVEEADGVHFITMELVRGKTLTELLPKNGFPVSRFFDIAIPLADAVAAAHQEGITHRDLKPDNVMQSDDGRIKVLDFGLAKPHAATGSSARDSDLPTAQRTQEGLILGTFAYMSPEQAEGKALDARSDIFSLGVLFYEMLTGQRPFQGETPASTLSAILKDTPSPVTEINSTLPRDLARIVKRCLAKSTSRRFQTALDVRNELEEVKEALASGELATVPSAPSVSAHRGWTLPIGVAALVLLAVSLGYYLGMGRETTTGSAVPQLTNPVQVTGDVGVEDYPSWSPDGRTIAYHSNQDGNWDIWVTQLGGGQAVNRTADFAGEDSRPSFSPDGTQIAFYSVRDGGGYFVMSALGGRPQKVSSAPFSISRPQWSNDGERLACVVLGEDGGREIEIVSLETRESRRYALPNSGSELSWSSDGRFFAYVDALSYEAEVTRLWVLDTSDEKSIPVTDGLTAVWGPSWSLDGRRLFFVSNRGGAMDLWQQRVTENGSPVEAPKRVTTGIGVRQASFSSDGTMLAYARGSRVANVWRVPILSERLATWDDAQQITFDQAFIEFIDVSPDGERLFVSSDRSGNQDLWTLPSEGGDMERLSSDPTPDWAPRLSPDGRQIVFYSYRTGNRDLWLMPAGGGPARQLTEHPGHDTWPRWSPDGRTIAFGSSRGGNTTAWTISADGGEPRRLDDGVASPPFGWAPDGEWVYYRRGQLLRAPVSGGEPESVSRHSVLVGWSVDGSKMYVFGEGAFWESAPDGGPERKLTELSGRRGNVLVVATDTDGRHLYFSWREDLGDIWVMDVVTDESE